MVPLRITASPLRTNRGDIAGHLVLIAEGDEAAGPGAGVDGEIRELEQQLAEDGTGGL